MKYFLALLLTLLSACSQSDEEAVVFTSLGATPPRELSNELAIAQVSGIAAESGFKLGSTASPIVGSGMLAWYKDSNGTAIRITRQEPSPCLQISFDGPNTSGARASASKAASAIQTRLGQDLNWGMNLRCPSAP